MFSSFYFHGAWWRFLISASEKFRFRAIVVSHLHLFLFFYYTCIVSLFQFLVVLNKLSRIPWKVFSVDCLESPRCVKFCINYFLILVVKPFLYKHLHCCLRIFFNIPRKVLLLFVCCIRASSMFLKELFQIPRQRLFIGFSGFSQEPSSIILHPLIFPFAKSFITNEVIYHHMQRKPYLERKWW